LPNADSPNSFKGRSPEDLNDSDSEFNEDDVDFSTKFLEINNKKIVKRSVDKDSPLTRSKAKGLRGPNKMSVDFYTQKASIASAQT
jgi:hypothetical protein